MKNKKKKIYEKPYRQERYKYDLLYDRLSKKEDDDKFWSKYYELNKKLKEEDQY